MFKLISLTLVAAIFAYALARPAAQDNAATAAQADAGTTSTTPAVIIKEVNVNNPDGSYNSSYETSNGIKVENIGYMKKITIPRSEAENGQIVEEHEEMILVQSGSYSYMDPEGHVITLRYVADENGFQPEGDHLPVAP